MQDQNIAKIWNVKKKDIAIHKKYEETRTTKWQWPQDLECLHQKA
jgi:hypothetical protein